LIRLFLRSFWISVAFGVTGWQLSLANGWPLSLVVWGAVAYAAFMVIFPLSLLWPIPVPALARRLDAAFALRDRLTTALEVARRLPGNYLEQRLLTSADRLLGSIRGRLSRQNHMPWTDLALAILAIAVLFGVYMNASTLDAPPPINAGAIQPPDVPALPTEPPVSLPGTAPEDALEPPAPDSSGGEQENGGSQNVQADAVPPEGAQAALDALTEALGEQALTQSAAADLAQGDAAAAAERLWALADQAASLDPEARQALAESLREAADQTRDAAPGVADQIDEAADAIAPDEGDPAESAAEAAAGLEGLANLLEALDQSRQSNSSGTAGTGGTGAGQGEGADVGRETQTGGTTDRLQTEGQPVELPADQIPPDEGGVLVPPEHDETATGTTDAPYTQTGASGSGGNQPADPLSFPWRLRRVIQRYFSPP
jgi:hypothetical protein